MSVGKTAREKLQRKAHRAVQRAVRNGSLKPLPCEVCGIPEGMGVLIQAHHEDYDRPLEVKWLCARHHTIRHAGRSYEQMGRDLRCKHWPPQPDCWTCRVQGNKHADRLEKSRDSREHNEGNDRRKSPAGKALPKLKHRVRFRKLSPTEN